MCNQICAAASGARKNEDERGERDEMFRQGNISFRFVSPNSLAKIFRLAVGLGCNLNTTVSLALPVRRRVLVVALASGVPVVVPIPHAPLAKAD